ncbi:hypothetical protein QAD02_000446 [Eretmocerus hayati]|uniref:Uncharacterized protein n=1 Tax=Eretmocerus hayati TaxID=131215 RepID=A0ACC2NDM5_9HYME|nr:hypothetical protein QAD02_000446 [Eretmocerus hayati]
MCERKLMEIKRPDRGTNDKDWLEALTVTTKGEVIAPEGSPKPSNIKRKQQADKDVKERAKVSDKVNVTAVKNLLCAPDIFSSEKEEAQDICHQSEDTEGTPKRVKAFKATSQKIGQTVRVARLVDDSGVRTNNPLKCPVCHPQSRGATPDGFAEYLISIGEYMKSRQDCFEIYQSESTKSVSEPHKPKQSAVQMRETVQTSKSSSKLTNDEKTVQDISTLLCPTGTDTVELMENSGILITCTDKFLIDRMSRKDPRALTRELFRKIVGEENLLKMTWSGRSNHQNFIAIPEKERVMIQAFVESHTVPKYRLKTQEFKECVTTFCNQLRQDQKKKEVDLVNKKIEPLKIKKEEKNKEEIKVSESVEVKADKEDSSGGDSSNETLKKRINSQTPVNNQNKSRKTHETHKEKRESSSDTHRSSESDQEFGESINDKPIFEHQDLSHGDFDGCDEEEFLGEGYGIASNKKCKKSSENQNGVKNMESLGTLTVAGLDSLSRNSQLISLKEDTESYNFSTNHLDDKVDAGRKSPVIINHGSLDPPKPFYKEKIRDIDVGSTENRVRSQSGTRPATSSAKITVEKGVDYQNDHPDYKSVQEAEQHSKEQHSRSSDSASPDKAKKRTLRHCSSVDQPENARKPQRTYNQEH